MPHADSESFLPLLGQIYMVLATSILFTPSSPWNAGTGFTFGIGWLSPPIPLPGGAPPVLLLSPMAAPIPVVASFGSHDATAFTCSDDIAAHPRGGGVMWLPCVPAHMGTWCIWTSLAVQPPVPSITHWWWRHSPDAPPVHHTWSTCTVLRGFNRKTPGILGVPFPLHAMILAYCLCIFSGRGLPPVLLSRAGCAVIWNPAVGPHTYHIW